MGKGAAFVETFAGFRVDGWAVGIIKEPFHEVGSWGHVLEALLILDADGVAAEVVRYPDRGDVHAGLIENLRVGIGSPGLRARCGWRRPRDPAPCACGR